MSRNDYEWLNYVLEENLSLSEIDNNQIPTQEDAVRWAKYQRTIKELGLQKDKRA